jgi:hypothetical protein
LYISAHKGCVNGLKKSWVAFKPKAMGRDFFTIGHNREAVRGVFRIF